MDLPPHHIPLMTLPDTVFFPNTVLPLHIFEARYRAMLRDVLNGPRCFAVAAIDPQRAITTEDPEAPFRFATAGLIRACQKAEDGTSNLLLDGRWRVKITAIVQEKPYRVVAASHVPEVADLPGPQMRRIRQVLVRALKHRTQAGVPLADEIAALIAEIEDPTLLCNLLLSSSVGGSSFRRKMLATIDLADRLAATIEQIRSETRDALLARRLQGQLADDDIADN